MRQRLTIILTFVVIIGVLVIINALTHVQEQQAHDLEVMPNRSTYHSGPTGTRALHDFLNESGHRVMRWRESSDRLFSESGRLVSTFVIVGKTRVPLEDKDYAVLLRWVREGGRLVVIDRSPNRQFLTGQGFDISIRDLGYPNVDTDPGDVKQMTDNVTALEPSQPTLLTNNIAEVMPSRFASRMKIEPVIVRAAVATGIEFGPSSRSREFPETESTPESTPAQNQPPPPAAIAGDEEDEVSTAPVVHVADSNGALLIDYAYGYGTIVLLSDPYVVTNGGIALNDNLMLAMNVLAGFNPTGLIAFDEYHQGRGITRNAFASYFEGTPVLAIAGQLGLLILVVLWTNGRRFGRPLPLPQVDRRSSLEFVSSMAELQERSRAFDLAIENIYSRTRRVLARHAGVDYNSSRAEIAQRIAARSTIDRNELETLMRECEETINGAPITARQSVQLVTRLRELEKELGLRMRSRDVRQAAEHI
ncbi:MAG TPA: DUF4350 domain-containing protein [Pyrinomonadaceae bacterium]|nr:DUF4350 domain-containing protein [Pyrinomonadaceae bacterium]